MIKNIRKTKKKMVDFYYEGLSLKNEDNSFFEVAPLISTNLGYFPITGVYRSKDEKLTTIKTKDYFLNVVKDDHTFLQYVENKEPIWKNLKELNIGDKIITLSGAQEIIEIIEANNGNVFDFRVDPTHAYFTNGILSHNSMIALSMMREPTIDLIVYFDSEGGGISEDFADFLGIDSSKILYQAMSTIEELKAKMGLVIDIVEKNKTKKNVLMIIDSISMLTTDRELDEKGGADMGNKAKQTREFFRSYIRKMQKMNIACVMTGHLTSTIGGYGPSKEVTGGTILQYAPSAEVRFAKVNAESEIEKSALGATMIKIRAEMVKSRFGTLGKRVKFDLDMERGLDPYAGLFDILRDYEMITPVKKDWDAQLLAKEMGKSSTGWWAFTPWKNEKLKSTYDQIIEKDLSKSGKWREKQLGEFCKNEWFLNLIQECLDSVFMMEKAIDEVVEDKEAEEIIAREVQEVESGEPVEKTSKKKKGDQATA